MRSYSQSHRHAGSTFSYCNVGICDGRQPIRVQQGASKTSPLLVVNIAQLVFCKLQDWRHGATCMQDHQTWNTQRQEACLTVCCNQWWISWVLKTIAIPSLLEKKTHSRLVCPSRVRRRQRWSANVTRTSKQGVFNKIHTMHVLRPSCKA